MQLITSLVAASSFLASNVIAHPGHDMSAEIEARAAFMSVAGKRDLSHCAAKMKARGIEQRTVSRRAAVMKDARIKRGIAADAPYLKARDADSVLNTTHLSSTTYSNATDESILFSGNSSCILFPEVTEGPYYVSGEYVREDVTEDQAGVELILDTQVIDMATCDPVTDAVIEIWHCNSTGVYAGVVASGNGNSGDATNINATFLRGLQPTDADGVAQFTTLFPGHYVGRTAHVHVLVHFNGTTYENGTYGGGYVSHVGQLFFDQDLITQVELTSPYSTNTQTLTTNAGDSILAQSAEDGADPLVEYSLLGDDVTSGVFGWIAFGINMTSEVTVSAAASLYASGGVENSGGFGGGGNSTGGNSTGGAPPS